MNTPLHSPESSTSSFFVFLQRKVFWGPTHSAQLLHARICLRYDVTKFAGVHPGGTQILLEYAGKDATEDFYALHRRHGLRQSGWLRKR